MTHKLGVMRKRAGGGGTVYSRTVEDCINMMTDELGISADELLTVADLTPEDVRNGVTLIGVNRCIEDAVVVTHTTSEDDVYESHTGDLYASFPLESMTSRYPFDQSDDSVDVIRAVATLEEQIDE